MENGNALVGAKFGPYVIERLLGEGGMGRVFVARHEVLDRQVVVKTMLPQFAGTALLQRFVTEAKAAALLDCRNVVRIIDTQTTADGTPYIVLEYLRGQSLHDWIERWRARTGQPVPATYATIILGQAANGIAHAHAAGIVHRDIKPENLFLVEAAPDTAKRLTDAGLPTDLLVKVLDFGIAKLHAPGASGGTATASALGTPAYMAPEQLVDAKTADARADVYALGAVAYQLVTGGHVPWGADTPMVRIYQRQIHEPPPNPADLNPALAPGVAAVIRRAMARDREQRWPTVDAFARAFAQAVVADAQLPAGPVLLAAYAPEIADGPVAVTRPGPLTAPMPGSAVSPTTLGSSVGSSVDSPVARRRGLAVALASGAIVAAGVVGFVLLSGGSGGSGGSGPTAPASSTTIDAGAAQPIDASDAPDAAVDAAPVIDAAVDAVPVDAVPVPVDAAPRKRPRPGSGSGEGSSRGYRDLTK